MLCPVIQAEIPLDFLHKPLTISSGSLNEDLRILHALAPIPIHNMLYGKVNTLKLILPDIHRLAKPLFLRIGDPHRLPKGAYCLRHLRTQRFHRVGFLRAGIILRVLHSGRSFTGRFAVIVARVFRFTYFRANIVIGKQIAGLYIVQANRIFARGNPRLLENILAKIKTRKMVISMPEKCFPASILL